MNKIILGETRYFLVQQWVAVILLIFFPLTGVFICLFSDIYITDVVELVLFSLFFCVLLFFYFWKKVLSLNLIIQKEKGVLIVKNFMREKLLQSDSIVSVDIVWLWSYGRLLLDSNKKYKFPLDGKHMKLKYLIGDDSVIIDEYKQRIQQTSC